MAFINDGLSQLLDDTPNRVIQGRRFERFIQAVFQAHPGVYGKERFKKVWMWNEWPDRETLGYQQDCGIDIVAEQTSAYGGGLCAIQCKFYRTGKEVPTSGVDSFLAASGTEHFTSRLLVTSVPVSKNGMSKLRRAVPQCGLLTTEEMNGWVDDWRTIISHPDSLIIPAPRKHRLHPFQEEAVNKTVDGFRTSDRGQLILPCGTGKSLAALRIAEKTAGPSGRVLYMVPSIALIGQTMREWSQQRNLPLQYLGVCSDPTSGRKQSPQADIAGDLTELAIPVTTNPDRLIEALAEPVPAGVMQVVFATYQSSPKIVATLEHLPDSWKFDLMVCDEAHRTTGIADPEGGSADSPFRVVHNNQKIRSARRLYMTATPRVFTERQRQKIEENVGYEDDSYSMDDPAVYGNRFYQMSFSRAVEGGYLSDYEVLVIAASGEGYAQSLDYVNSAGEPAELSLSDAVKLVGCWDALASPDTTGLHPGREPGQIASTSADVRPSRSAIAFTSLVKTSKKLADAWPQLANKLARESEVRNPDVPFLEVAVSHVDGTTPAATRTNALDKLRASSDQIDDDNGSGLVCNVISNARVFAEGVDVPSLDAVLFFDHRTSEVDITQAVGRAMRKAPGKKKGYIVIPVVVPEGASAVEMLKASDFKTVWSVVRALRSHDNRMEYYVSNRNVWTAKAPVSARVIGGGASGASEQVLEQLTLALSSEIASQVVETVGVKRMYPSWGEKAAGICANIHLRVSQLIRSGEAKVAFGRFLSGIRESVGGHVTRAQAEEMVAQHVVTAPVFDVMLGRNRFTAQNPVSREIARLLAVFKSLGVSFDVELRPLKRAYRQMSNAFDGAVSPAERVDILREIYDGFFHSAMKDTVKQVGIVYTPVEIVDFMIRSAEAICQKEFGRSLSSPNFHILDPFTGTGTFLTRILETKTLSGDYLVRPEDLDRKYKHELHANELILLAYYIAAIKIEEAKHARDIASGQDIEYVPYSRIVLTDTFLTSAPQASLDAFGDNTRAGIEQSNTPITAVLANPPWSSGQKSAGDDNPNRQYDATGDRVKVTYVAKHKEITGRAPGGNAAGNLYIKALRWCSDRVSGQNEDQPTVIGLVHPNSLTDGTSFAGARACLRDEFTDIYVVNLRGNAYKSGEERRKEGSVLFDAVGGSGGSRNGVQITFLVRNPNKPQGQPAVLRYAQVPDYMSLDQKFKWLADLGDVTSDQLDVVPVTDKHDWVNISDGSFEGLLPVCDTDKGNKDVAATKHASGVKTNCDTYVYSFSREGLIDKMRRLIEAYNESLDWYEDNPTKELLKDATVNKYLNEIKWTNTLKSSLRQRKRIVFDEGRIREVLYRPFVKLWLYEDDRILSSVKTVSAMFPRDDGLLTSKRERERERESNSRHQPVRDGSLRNPRQQNNRGYQSGRNRTSPPCHPQKVAILISSGNNMVFQPLVTVWLTDLAAVKGSQQTRVIPRVR